MKLSHVVVAAVAVTVALAMVPSVYAANYGSTSSVQPLQSGCLQVWTLCCVVALCAAQVSLFVWDLGYLPRLLVGTNAGSG